MFGWLKLRRKREEAMNYAGEHDMTVAPGVNATGGDHWVPLDRYGGWG